MILSLVFVCLWDLQFFGLNPKVPAIRSLTCVLDWCMMHVCLTDACACAALWLKPIAVCFQQFALSSNRSLLQQWQKNAKCRQARWMYTCKITTIRGLVHIVNLRIVTSASKTWERNAGSTPIAKRREHGLHGGKWILFSLSGRLFAMNADKSCGKSPNNKRPKTQRRMRAMNTRPHRAWIVTERFACFVQFYWIRECLTVACWFFPNWDVLLGIHFHATSILQKGLACDPKQHGLHIMTKEMNSRFLVMSALKKFWFKS